MRFSIVPICVLLAACAPVVQGMGAFVAQPALAASNQSVRAYDGLQLPLRVWPAKTPKAIVLALHGFNDYSNAFRLPGPWLASQGITVYAYDQRGFGANPHPGLWPGEAALVADFKVALEAVRARHPGHPLFVLGDSMGGAVAMAAMGSTDAPAIEGLVLAAPAVWGWSKLNPAYQAALWIGSHMTPWFRVTGQGLEIWPSDNIEMLKEQARDPRIIKQTRLDALFGLVRLMEAGYNAAPGIRVPVLLLYGEQDQIVPRGPVFDAYAQMRADKRMALYPRGYHMLLRDLSRMAVWRDLAAWLANSHAPLPSGHEFMGDPVAPGAQLRDHSRR